jgi:hypothetical protein
LFIGVRDSLILRIELSSSHNRHLVPRRRPVAVPDLTSLTRWRPLKQRCHQPRSLKRLSPRRARYPLHPGRRRRPPLQRTWLPPHQTRYPSSERGRAQEEEESRRRPLGLQIKMPLTQWLPVDQKRAELEACDRAWAAQGRRIRVWPVVTLQDLSRNLSPSGVFFPPEKSAR